MGQIKTWYEHFASTADALKTCEKKNNNEWAERHADNLDKLLDLLPHGSGIDGEWRYGYFSDRLELYNLYHFMDDNGYYDGWGDFTVVVKPSFSGVTVAVIGRRDWPKRYRQNGLLDYLHESLNEGVQTLVQQVFDVETKTNSWVTHDRFKLLGWLYSGKLPPDTKDDVLIRNSPGEYTLREDQGRAKVWITSGKYSIGILHADGKTTCCAFPVGQEDGEALPASINLYDNMPGFNI